MPRLNVWLSLVCILAVVHGAAKTSVVKKTQMRKSSVPEILLSGSGARGVAQTIMYPMDAVKTLVQQNMAITARSITNGAVSTSLLSLPTGVLQFYVYDTLKPWLTKRFPAPSMTTPVDLVSGAAGAFFSCFTAVPQEVLKQRMIVGMEGYPNALAGVRTMAASPQGLMGFFTGFWATAFRNVPFNALCFTFTSQFKSAFERVNNRKPNSPEVLVLGILSATVSAVITNPIDVVKTRLMTQSAGQAYAGIGDCLVTIMAKEGPLAFYKGLLPRILYLAPTFGLIFAVNNAMKEYFVKRGDPIEFKLPAFGSLATAK